MVTTLSQNTLCAKRLRPDALLGTEDSIEEKCSPFAS